MTTKSGRFRVFSIEDEPRFNPPAGMFHLTPDELRGEWTFEPNPRTLTIIEQRRKERGETVVPCFYATTYATADEASAEAEKWESGEVMRMDEANACLLLILGDRR